MKPSGPPSLFRICLLLVMFLSYTDTYVFSKPRGGQVVSGTASFTQDGNLTVITAGNRSVINYQSFDIGKNETVQFVQPGASATVLNRVLTPDPTNIFGHLEANGIVIISNPYGVFFQNGSVVNVGGLIAGAGKISDADFTAGKVHFTDLTGDVRNDGVVAADNRIALMGANVVNAGSLRSAHGVAMMVSGPDVYVGERNGNIFVQANGKALKAATAAGATAPSAGSVTNSGTVAAPRVLLGAGDLYSTAIVNSGLLQGRSVAVNAGKSGSVTLGGKVDATSASNPTTTGTGGNIDVLGGAVALKGATLDASGAAAGGNIRVGGDFHGASALAASATTTVDAASTLKADAVGATGNGGTVVLWSGNSTSFGGNISARGGAAGGNGGTVEVSSHGGLGYQGLVDAGAPAGKVGSLLLDPSNIDIVPGAPLGDGTVPTAPVNTPPGTLTVSQGALEGTTGNIALTASNDIRIEPLTDAVLGTTLAFPGTGSVTFTAGANTSTGAASTGSFVMARLSDSISNPGQTLTINANGASPAGGGNLNVGNNAAIEAGQLSTANAAVGGTNGGSVFLNVTSATAAPVRVGAITTASTNGNAGNITIGGATFTGNITTGTGGNAGTLTATAAGTGGAAGGAVGAGGTVTLNTSGAVTLAGAVDTSSAGAGAGGITIGTTGSAAVPASITADDVLTAAATGTTAARAGAGGAITLNSTGVISLQGDVTTSSATAGAGNITIGAVASPVFPTTITTGTGNRLTATSTGTGAGLTGAGGQIFLNATTGGITLGGAVSAASSGAAGGAISIAATGAVSTGNLIASSAVSSATAVGSVAVATNGTLAVNGVNTSSAAGPGGAVTMGPPIGLATTLPTTLTVGAVNTAGSTATAGGAITLETLGKLTVAATNPSFTGDATLVASTTNATSYTTNGYDFSLTLTGAVIDLSSIADTPHNLTLGGQGVLIDEATFTSTGTQTFNAPVTLNTSATLTSSGGGDITFAAVDSAAANPNQDLTVNTTGNEIFNGAVGATHTLGSLTTDGNLGAGVVGTGSTQFRMALPTTGTAGSPLGGVNLTGALAVHDNVSFATTTGTASQTAPTVISGGAQSYAGTATVSSGTYLTSLTSGSTLTLAAVNGSGTQALTLNTAGTVILGGAIGGASAATALGSLTTVGGQEVDINGGAIRTNAAAGQNFSGPVVLGAIATLTAANGPVTFASSVNGAEALTVNATGVTTFGGNVGSVANEALTSLNVSNGPTNFTLASGTAPLTVTTTGTDATTNNGQTYHGAVTLGSAVTVNAGAAPVDFVSTVGSSTTGGATTPEALAVTTGGLTTFGGAVGGASLTATAAPALASLTVTNAAQINATTVTTVGAQTYGSLTLGGTGTTTLASTGSAAAVSTGDVTGGGNGLTVDVNQASTAPSNFGAITTTGALRFTLGGTTNFTGAINAGSVNVGTTFAGGDFVFTGSTVTTTGGQTYGGTNAAVILGAPLALSDTNKGNISLPQVASLGTPYALTVSTGGTTTFTSAVGAIGGGTVAPASVQVGLAGASNLGGTVQFSGTGITTTGAAGQVYNDKAVLAAATTLNAGSGPVTFAQTLGSATTPEPLTVATSGTTTFGGAVGGALGTNGLPTTTTAAPALYSLSVSGPTVISGGQRDDDHHRADRHDADQRQPDLQWPG